MRFIHIFTVIALLFIATGQAQIESFPGAQLLGRWTGAGAIIVNWCAQDSLPVNIVIHKDGTVSGKIGDATITDGQFRLNSRVLRFLGNSTYLIEADLSGALIAKENIERKHITLFLDFKNGRLSGGFHSSGGKGGDKASMKLSGSGLALVRSNTVSIR